MRCLVVLIGISLSAPPLARAGVVKYGLIAGNNRGEPQEVELLYAQDDARRIARILERVGGFRSENITVLADASSDDFRTALITLNDRIRQDLQNSDNEVLLLVFYSGHADSEELHLGKTALPIPELRRLVRGSAASFRILLLDACKSGFLTRVKGGRPVESFDIQVDDKLGTEGTVFITSSAADEDAQESDQFGSSFFTHFFTSGLLGAADYSRDNKVSLAEAYRYAHEQTVKATSKTWAGTQHPTFQYDIKGKGDVVLSDLALDRYDKSALTFETPGHFLIMKNNASGSVVAEVSSLETNRRVVVEPGTYFVRERRADELREGTVAVSSNETTAVRTDEFERIGYARLVRKGGTGRRIAHGPQLFYRFRGEVLNGLGPMHLFGVSYPVVLPWFTLTPRIGYGQARAENDILEVETREVDLLVAATRAFDWSRFTVAAGLQIGGAYWGQRFETPGLAPDRDAFGFLLGGIGTATVHLPEGFHAEVTGEALTYLVGIGADREGGGVGTALTYGFGVSCGRFF